MNKKSKLANCKQCPLFEQSMVLGETNCKDDLSKVDVLILAEAPAQTEIKQNRPLVGKAGKVFRREFAASGLDTLNYLITNVVLCSNLNVNPKTDRIKSETPPDEAIDMCQTHWKTLVDITNPKFIFIMGGTAAKIFNISGQITKIRGEFFNYISPTAPEVKPKIFVTLHPSYIDRGSAPQEHVEAFKQDFRSLYFAITGKESDDSVNKNTTRDLLHLNKPYMHELPSWMKTDDVCLIDAQKYAPENKILFIMRDKEGKRLYHKFNADNYYFYEKEESIGNAPMLAPIKDVGLVQSNNKSSKLAAYESDVKPEVKYTIDYYLQRETEEPNVPLKKMFFDIEVYNKGSKAFPNPKQAVAPINAISFKLDDDKTKVFIVKPPNFDKVKLDKFDEYEITFFDNEKELMYEFMSFVRKTEPDVMAGWNCISENEMIWLDDKIIAIKDVVVDNNLFKNGKIKKKVNTGVKKGQQVKLKHGFAVTCSNNHIFPIYSKEKYEYKYPKSLLETKEDASISNIKKLLKKKDVYMKVELGENTNRDLTYKEILLNNIDNFLEYNDFDIQIIDVDIRNKLKSIPKIRQLIEHNEYWYGDRFFTRTFKWSYKNLKEWINKEDIINQINKFDSQYFIINNRRIKINLNEIINSDDLKLLGLEYTDGFWSGYDNMHNICNSNTQLVSEYAHIMNNYRTCRIDNITEFKRNDGCYYLKMGGANRFTLLTQLIYDKSRKKNLNITLLSKLSKTQFLSFFSGLIDGDGSISSTSILVCNFEKNKDLDYLQQLLLWNGFIAYKGKNYISIPNFKSNMNMFNISLSHSDRQIKFKNLLENNREYKNTPSKNLNKFILDDGILLKIESIDDLKRDFIMYDIETETNYFICNSIKTHNCNGFDIPYIYNRLLKNGMDVNKMSPLNYFFVNIHKYNDFILSGIYVLDMYELYKTLTTEGRESYKLGAIATLELGEGKVEYEGSLDELYMKDLNKFIRYSGQDTKLLNDLDETLGHIDLKNELRRICGSTWKFTESTTGQVDPLCISYAKKQGMVCRTADIHALDSNFVGAYVRNPIPGIHSWLVDFDFTSLYPSIIVSCNMGPDTYIGKIDKDIAFDYIYNKNIPESLIIRLHPMKEDYTEISMTKQEFEDWMEENNAIMTITGTLFIGHDKKKSFFSDIMTYLLDSRKQYKKEMFKYKDKDEIMYGKYFNIQWAYKILANSIYGVLGTPSFRMFKIDLAESVTSTGQEVIKFAAHHLSKYMVDGKTDIDAKFLNNFEESKEYLIYMDTDSLFIDFSSYLDKKVNYNANRKI
ncbi:MAG: hypothetical protein KAS32_26250 [Candidatus Peribacteraceae bacterium]|nr:hypothetical protein [Candidatus Peribacteraceae bacterium]